MWPLKTLKVKLHINKNLCNYNINIHIKFWWDYISDKKWIKQKKITFNDHWDHFPWNENLPLHNDDIHIDFHKDKKA